MKIALVNLELSGDLSKNFSLISSLIIIRWETFQGFKYYYCCCFSENREGD